MKGVHRDVVGRSANNIPLEVDEKGSHEARCGTVAFVDDARSCGQRGRGRSAQADADRDGRRCARRGSSLRLTLRLGRGAPRAGGVGGAVWADRPLGIEGSASWGRHTAMFLAGRGHDVRDVCANRTPRSDRAASAASPTRSTASGSPARHWRLVAAQGVQARRPGARPASSSLLALWNNRRRSILTGRQHLVGEAEYLLCELPLELREQLQTPRRSSHASRRSRAATAAGATTRRPGCGCSCSTATVRRSMRSMATSARCSRNSRRSLTRADRRWRALRPEHPLGRRAVVEVGDPRRFTEGGFARFNG